MRFTETTCRALRPFFATGLRLLVMVTALLGGPWLQASHPLEEWTQRGPLPTSRELRDVAQGEGKLVVVFADPAGRALVSEDGVDFEAEPLNLPAGLAATDILYVDGKWLVLAGGRVWSKSAWADAWQEGDAIPHGMAALRALDGGFWGWSAGGWSRGPVWRDSVLYRSEDGLAWTAVPVGDALTDRFAITDLIHAAGTFVLTNSGHSNSAGIWTSTDGIEWTAATALNIPHHSIAYGNGRFVAGASGGRISISMDGQTWTSAQFPFILHYLTNWQPGSGTPVYSEVRELVFSNGAFVTLGQGMFGYPILAESGDGESWTAVTGDDPGFARAAAKSLRQIGESTYLLGSSGNLWRTTRWQEGSSQLLPLNPWDWHAIAASENRVVVAGEGGNVVWSEDAETFHSLQLPDAADVLDLVHAPELSVFLAVGGTDSGARVWRSADGLAWTAHTPAGFTGAATGAAWNGEQWIICGPNGQLASSPDGIDWIVRNSGTTGSLTAIEWGSGRFVATGSGGIVIHSADGIVWTSHTLGPEHVTYRGLVHGNGLWIVPDGYELHLSTDLVHWWKSSGQSYRPNPLFAFGEFIASDHRHVLGSSDGIYWQSYVDGYGPETKYPVGTGFDRGVRFGNRVVFVGENGLIGVSGAWRDFFREWQEASFTTDEIDRPEMSGPDADPDGDGWPNALEYAFGLHPKSRNAFDALRTSLHHMENEYYFTGSIFALNHPWLPQRPGVSVWPERSKNLIDWSRDGFRIDPPFSTGTGSMRREIRLPIQSSGPEFIRLRGEVNFQDWNEP